MKHRITTSSRNRRIVHPMR